MDAKTEERFAAALEALARTGEETAKAVALQAVTNESLAKEVRHLRATIQGAQGLVRQKMKEADEQGEAHRREGARIQAMIDERRKGEGDAGSTPT